jgi:hypothetical protein
MNFFLLIRREARTSKSTNIVRLADEAKKAETNNVTGRGRRWKEGKIMDTNVCCTAGLYKALE